MGAGKMGSFFIDLLSFDHEVAVFERDAKRMRFTYNCQRFTSYEEIKAFKPELLINAVTLKYTIPVFKEVIPYLPKECIISDIASVKTDLKDFYEQTGMRYVSTHPMFGPTFATRISTASWDSTSTSTLSRSTTRRWLIRCQFPSSQPSYSLLS